MQSLPDYIRPAPFAENTRATDNLSDGANLLLLRQRTLSSYALPARLLLAALRLNGDTREMSDLDRCLLDSIGRILDSSSNRQQTIAAVNQFSSIALTRTRSPLKIPSPGSVELSDDEQLLIDAASRQLQGHHSAAVSRLQWLMDPETSRHFLQSIDIIADADCFRQHGMYALAPCPVRLGSQDDEKGIRHNSVLQCADLSLEERLLVNVTRVWVKCISLRISSLSAVHRLSSCLGLSGLDTTMHDILHRTAYHATRQFDVRCLCCEEVSPDEARLLATLAAVGHGLPGESVEHLNHWLPPTSVQSVLAKVSGNRKNIFQHDFSLPSRQWDFAGLAQRQILFDQDRTQQAEHNVH